MSLCVSCRQRYRPNLSITVFLAPMLALPLLSRPTVLAGEDTSNVTVISHTTTNLLRRRAQCNCHLFGHQPFDRRRRKLSSMLTTSLLIRNDAYHLHVASPTVLIVDLSTTLDRRGFYCNYRPSPTVSTGDDAATAYKDAVDRFLGKTVDLKFVQPKPAGLVRNFYIQSQKDYPLGDNKYCSSRRGCARVFAVFSSYLLWREWEKKRRGTGLILISLCICTEYFIVCLSALSWRGVMM